MVGPSVCPFVRLSIRLTSPQSICQSVHLPVRPSRVNFLKLLIFVDFRPISGAFPAFHLSRIFSFPTDTLILFFPEHFKWLTGTIPQFIAVLQKHKLNLVLEIIDESLGWEGGGHDVERTTLDMCKRHLLLDMVFHIWKEHTVSCRYKWPDSFI